MDFVNNIIPVSALKQRLPKIIEQLKKNQTSFLLTQNGKSAAFLVDVDLYQQQMKRLKILEGLLRAELDIEQGKVKTQPEVESLLDSWKNAS